MSDFDQHQFSASSADALDNLKQGREHYERRAWADAYSSLSLADVEGSLGVDDLELLATSAYLIGREDEYLRALDRAHHLYLYAREDTRAARSAFWMGLCLLFRGEADPATGWFGRAQRLIEREGLDCVEQGYLLLPLVEQQLSDSDSRAAHATALRAADIGERFEESDLIACAHHLQGRALMQQGQVERGLALLDEAMVAVIAGELSPLMTGLIYCSVIDSCLQVYALARAREWTSALAQWCAEQPQLVNFTGTRHRCACEFPVVVFAPCMIPAGVDGNPVKPGRELAAPLETANLCCKAKTYLMSHVLSFSNIAKEPIGEPVKQVVVTLQEGLEGITLTSRGPLWARSRSLGFIALLT